MWEWTHTHTHTLKKRKKEKRKQKRVKVPQSVKTAKRREKDKQWYQFRSGTRILTLTVEKNWKEFTNETSDRCLQELNLLCCWQLSPLYTCNSLSTVSGACGWSARAAAIILARAVRAAFSEHVIPFHKFSQSDDMVGLTAGLHVDLDWTFKVKVNTKMARQQQQFWRDLQVCFCQIYVFVQKRMFYTRTGRTACLCPAS